jgi:thiol-disulfide isomerase/thioredoxin
VFVAAIFAVFAPAQTSLLHQEAPSFVRPDLSGKQVDLAAFRGKVVLLNFWATWCAPCRVELPRFAAWQTRYGSAGLQVIAVSMDDDPALARTAADRLHLNFPVVQGDEELGTRYGGVLGLPITFLIGRDGKVIARIQGATDLHALERRVRKAVATK